jgi:hypothetical protein
VDFSSSMVSSLQRRFGAPAPAMFHRSLGCETSVFLLLLSGFLFGSFTSSSRSSIFSYTFLLIFLFYHSHSAANLLLPILRLFPSSLFSFSVPSLIFLSSFFLSYFFPNGSSLLRSA